MKIKDGFYASSHGIGGLMLDMPIKNPKTRQKSKFKIGDMSDVKQKSSSIRFVDM